MSNWGSALGALAVVFAMSGCTSDGPVPSLSSLPSTTPSAGVPLIGHSLCGDHVMVDFPTDDEMYAAVDGVAADERVRQVYTENKEQAFEHFKETLKEQPELVKIARPEALPAGLKVMPKQGADVRALAEDLRPKLPRAKRVEAFVRPAVVPGAGECPPDGEWPAR